MASPANEKRLQDSGTIPGAVGYWNLSKDYLGREVGGMTKVLPAPSQTHYSDVFDLGASELVRDRCVVAIDVPALSDHTDPAASHTLTLCHGDTESTATDETSPLIQLTLPGVAVTGSAAGQWQFRLPVGLKQFISFRQAADATAGRASVDGPGGLGYVTYRLAM